MGEAAWKKDERRIAEEIGGQRVPVNGPLNGREGKPDIQHSRLAVEVKRTSRRMAFVDAALEQAARGVASGSDILPVAIIHYTGTSIGNARVVMRLADFARLSGVWYPMTVETSQQLAQRILDEDR